MTTYTMTKTTYGSKCEVEVGTKLIKGKKFVQLDVSYDAEQDNEFSNRDHVIITLSEEDGLQLLNELNELLQSNC